MPQTAIEKIVGRHALGLTPGQHVHAGDFVTIRPKHVMTHDNTGAVIPKFVSICSPIGSDGDASHSTSASAKIKDPRQPVFGMDHDIQNTTPANLGKYAKIEKFAREQGVVYYPPGRGIAHQVMIEEGYVTPGSLVVGSDSHSNLYGAAGAVGTPIVRTDAAAIWATEQTWWQIPPMARVTLTGTLPPGASGKDIIITLCGHFKNDEVLNHAIEFVGDGVASLSMDERLTISNMTTEWGALVGMFPFDEVLREALLVRADEFAQRRSRHAGCFTRANVEGWWADRGSMSPDDGAHYAVEVSLDLSSVTPHVSGPNSVKVMTPVSAIERERITIHKAYLMSCVNARLSDFAKAAAVFSSGNGEAPKRVSTGVTLYIAAASSTIEAQARELGYWDTLVSAGAKVLPPGCGACIGLGEGTLEPNEVGISATNRNFQGRMGSRDALCYLASPAVVAASAICGYIAAPGDSAPVEPRSSIRINPAPQRPADPVDIIEGFPARVEGRALYLPADNLNTDGIYSKDVTYRDDITFEEQGQHAMLNYDPAFQDIAKAGDIIVGGRNFGTGSSREQAATALASKGIRMVIAASSSQTYKRNAFNNGFIVIECPALVDALADAFAPEATSGTGTIIGPELVVDFSASRIDCLGQSFTFGALSPTAQELVAAGGSAAVVRRQMANV